MGSDVRAVTIDQLLAHPEFPDLIQEYAEESSIEGMPHPIYKLEAYRGYEELGLIHIFEAVRDGALVGFITVIAPVLPHYSLPVAVVESFFVGSKNRAGGPGLRLLAAAEQQALEVGSPGLLVSAPFRGRLHELLPKCGYAETNRIFFKRVDHEQVASSRPNHAPRDQEGPGHPDHDPGADREGGAAREEDPGRAEAVPPGD